jgi:bacteriocin-like protein
MRKREIPKMEIQTLSDDDLESISGGFAGNSGSGTCSDGNSGSGTCGDGNSGSGTCGGGNSGSGTCGGGNSGSGTCGGEALM